MNQEERLLHVYADNDRDRRVGNHDARAVQKAVSKELQELGYYIIANRDDPEHPIFHLQRIGEKIEHLYEVHG